MKAKKFNVENLKKFFNSLKLKPKKIWVHYQNSDYVAYETFTRKKNPKDWNVKMFENVTSKENTIYKFLDGIKYKEYFEVFDWHNSKGLDRKEGNTYYLIYR